MSVELYILGGSGHALVVIEIARLKGWNVAGYFDLKPSSLLTGIPYMGAESADFPEEYPNARFFPAVGDNELREKLCSVLKPLNTLQLIHPAAIVSADAKIGMSTMIGARAVVNPVATIGEGVIINTGAIIEHECVIGNYTHIAPGATLLGNVQVGDRSFVGANAVVKQGVKIGSNVVIGAGAVVLNDVPDNCTMVGNPAKMLN